MDQGKRPRPAGGWLAVTVLTLAACTVTDPQAVPQAAGDTRAERAPVYLFDADPHGAVVVGGNPATMRGIDRSGRVVWTDEPAGNALAHAVCLAQCPDALISSSLDSLRSPAVADGLPRSVINGITRTLPSPTSTKNRVLAADNASQVTATGDENGWFIDVANGPATAIRIRVGGWPTSWQATSDNSTALAITAATASSDVETRRFVRTPSGWTPDDKPQKSNTEFGCTSARHGRLLIATPRPVLLDGQKSHPVAGLEAGSECSFAESGAIIVQNAIRNGKPSARVVTIDNEGHELFARDFSGEVRVRADSRSDRVVLLTANTATVQGLTGNALAHYTDVDDARFDEEGTLVIVNRTGTVRWVSHD